MKPECDTCKFYEYRFGSAGKEGNCRRNPPSSDYPKFPKVSPSDWCGEWKSKSEVLNG